MALRERAFGQQLIRLRNARGLNQHEAAMGIGISPRQYQNWEAGAIPRSAALRRIAAFYDLPVSKLTEYIPEPDEALPPTVRTQLERIEQKLDRLLGERSDNGGGA